MKRDSWTLLIGLAFLIAAIALWALVFTDEGSTAARPRVSAGLMARKFGNAEWRIWRHNLAAAQADSWRTRCSTLDGDRNANGSRFYCHFYAYTHLNRHADRLVHIEGRVTTLRSSSQGHFYEDGTGTFPVKHGVLGSFPHKRQT